MSLQKSKVCHPFISVNISNEGGFGFEGTENNSVIEEIRSEEKDIIKLKLSSGSVYNPQLNSNNLKLINEKYEKDKVNKPRQISSYWNTSEPSDKKSEKENESSINNY